MTYYINVQPSNFKDLQQILRSLQNLGIIDSFGSAADLVKEGEPISTKDLVALLEHTQKEVASGQAMSHEEVKENIESWKKKHQ